MKIKPFHQYREGYGAMFKGNVSEAPDTTTPNYAKEQEAVNREKVYSFLIPLIDRINAASILDVGCGVGTMVQVLVEDGYDAYGVDLPGLVKFWQQRSLPKERFFVIAPYPLNLPFLDNTLDFVFSLGVIEHVGTSDGHATRRADYHDIRRQWLREIWRIIKPGGHLLIGGPNRNFPVDVAHGLDPRASRMEKTLSKLTSASVHRTCGSYFLWGYQDVKKYLKGLSYRMEGLSVFGLLAYGRVPPCLTPLVRGYVRFLPKTLLTTGFNPWMLALIEKIG